MYGSTINDLAGARAKNRKQICFFHGNAYWRIIFPRRRPLEIYLIQKKAFEIYFFLEKGLRIFFLDFLHASPQTVTGHPLKNTFSFRSQCSPTRLHYNVTYFQRSLIEYPQDTWNVNDKALTITVL